MQKTNLYKYEVVISAFILFLSISAYAQSSAGTIKGTVTNEITGKPVNNVNIYLAFTMTGTTSDEEGNFLIEGVPQGSYLVIFSHVNFHRKSLDLTIEADRIIEQEINLKPKIYELDTVAVVSDNADEWKRNLEIFEKRLIGTSTLAEDVIITNPEIINFKRNDVGNLVAYTDKPIQIMNYALGYKITYYLDYFEADEFSTKYAGIPVFRELPVTDNEKQLRWEEKRSSAYLGSLRHFLSLVCESYDSTVFYKTKIQQFNSQPDIFNPEDLNRFMDSYEYFFDNSFIYDSGFKIISRFDTENKYIKNNFSDINLIGNLSQGDSQNEVIFNNMKRITIRYFLESPDDNYLLENEIKKRIYPTSSIDFLSNKVSVDKQGRYFDKFMIHTSGYLAFERLAESLPYEYELPANN